MASGRGLRSLHLLIPALVVLAGCTGTGAMPSLTTVPVTATSSMATSTTSTTLATATTTTTIGDLPEIDAEVLVPEGAGPHPAVVLVHGGGWVGGSPGTIRALAAHLTAEGFLTVNPRYKLSTNGSPGFPAAVDDIACAVRYAAIHPDGDGTVAVVGHSAGAHIGALVALTGDHYGEDCPAAGSGLPSRFVGLAGPYDVSRLGFLMLPFFGAGPTEAPESWLAGNPQSLADQNPTLVSLIIHGDSDGFVDPAFSVDFHQALDRAGSQTHLEILPGARHLDLASPTVVGDFIVTWLER